MLKINPAPKDIQEGTLNALCMIRNEITRSQERFEAGRIDGHEHVREAGLQLDDLIDHVLSRALVITRRVEPLDHTAIEKMKKEAYQAGTVAGARHATASEAKRLRGLVNEALKGIL